MRGTKTANEKNTK